MISRVSRLIRVVRCLGGGCKKRERLLPLIIVNFYLLFVTSIYFRFASVEVGQKGDPVSNVAAVVVKPVETNEDGRK